MKKKNIAIIMGGFSSEHDISIKSGNVVYTHLNNKKYNKYRVLISKDKWVCIDENDQEHPIDKSDFSVQLGSKLTFDCVFNAIHGSPGEDGLITAYFSLLGIPLTSCGHYQAALTFSKRDLLSTLKPHGIQSAISFFVDKGDTINEEAIIDKVGLPCFVKANRAGSSYGVSKVYQRNELASAIDRAFKEDDEVIIESFLDGTEVSVGVITYNGAVKVLPMTEIVSENDFFDFEAKYLGKSEEITPARISDDIKLKIDSVAKKVYEILKLSGYSRSEYIIVKNEPYLLEVNTTPGLTEESILPKQALEAGISLSELFESSIVEVLKD